MDGAVFEKWVREMDKKFVSVGRKVALVINSCRTHRQVKNLKLKKLFFQLVAAWDGVTTKFVLNCFWKSKISSEKQKATISEENDAFKELEGEIENVRSI